MQGSAGATTPGLIHLAMRTDNHRMETKSKGQRRAMRSGRKGGHLPGQKLNSATLEINQAQAMRLARILAQTDALMGALKQYGKLGRHASSFP